MLELVLDSEGEVKYIKKVKTSDYLKTFVSSQEAREKEITNR